MPTTFDLELPTTPGPEGRHRFLLNSGKAGAAVRVSAAEATRCPVTRRSNLTPRIEVAEAAGLRHRVQAGLGPRVLRRDRIGLKGARDAAASVASGPGLTLFRRSSQGDLGVLQHVLSLGQPSEIDTGGLSRIHGRSGNCRRVRDLADLHR